jgi:hypothetical protein
VRRALAAAVVVGVLAPLPTALMPGVNPATFATQEADFAASVAAAIAGAKFIPAEPPLHCYVTASCARTQPAGR